MSSQTSIAQFFSSRVDRLIGAPGRDRFVLSQPWQAYYGQFDTIAFYNRDDVIDLPGTWGRGGRGVTLRRPLFTFRGKGDLISMIERSLRPGHVGFVALNDPRAGVNYNYLFWNRGSAGIFSNEDVGIILSNYRGPVTIV